MADFQLKSSQFRRERERSWKELDRILDEVQRRGVQGLSPHDLRLLPSLYRGAASSLSVARAISLDRNLLDYLEALVCRAFVVVYSSKRPAREVVSEFFASRFPRAVYRIRWLFLASLLLLFLGYACGLSLTLADPERFWGFVPEGMAGGRNPEASSEALRDALFGRGGTDGTPREGWQRGLTAFASFLFTHNAKIGILCFSLGFVAGVPVVILLFYNGLTLGAMSALYTSRGLGGDFLAWVMGHGVTELGAVCLCGAAGLAIAAALLFPGKHPRSANLAIEGRSVAPVVVGSVLMFLAAACIESYFRELVPSTLARWLVAGSTLVLWLVYFVGRGRAPSAPSLEPPAR
jgi:uncharacterized membrane protein SpoIIM required for sporulation